MNDSLIILGYVVLTAALMAGSFALGRWERRTVYTPGPPVLEPEATMPIIERMSREESVRLVPRYPSSGRLELPKDWGPPVGGPIKDPVVRQLIWDMTRNLDVAPGAFNDWPPPGQFPDGLPGAQNYILFPEEQEFWMEKLGDPTKKEQQ